MQDTKLADRATTTDVLKSKNREASAVTQPASAKGTHSNSPAETSSNAEALAKIQKELSEAQRSRGTLQSHLNDVSDDLQKSKLQSAMTKKRLDGLASEKAALARRLRDQDEELRAKAKLLEVRIRGCLKRL